MASIATAAILLLASALAFCLGRRSFTLAIIAVCLLANVLSLLVYYLAPKLSEVTYLVAMREMSVYLFVFISLALWKKFVLPFGHLIDKIYLGLGVFFTVAILISFVNFGSGALVMGRELIFPIATYWLFRFIDPDEKTIRIAVRFIIILAAIAGSLAVLEYIYLNWVDPFFWRRIRISGYLVQKYGQFEGDFPLSWVNYLPVFIGQPPSLRSIGLMLDPLASAHFLACSFVLALYWLRGMPKYVAVGLIGLGVVCTFSKAGLLLCFLALSCKALTIRNRFTRWFLVSSVTAVVVALGLGMLSTGDDSFTHAGSFREGLTAVIEHPFGNGVGSTGYFAFLVSGNIENLGAIDTTFSVYTYQLGIGGLIALILLTLAPALYCLARVVEQRQARQIMPLTLTCFLLLGSYSFLAFSTAAAFTAVPIFIPMLILATHVSQEVRTARYRAPVPRLALRAEEYVV